LLAWFSLPLRERPVLSKAEGVRVRGMKTSGTLTSFLCATRTVEVL